MTQFKVGDRVIVIVEQPFKCEGKLLYPKGEVFEISQRCEDYNTPLDSGRYFKDSDYMWVIPAWHLELEEVYNSPLYKALK